MIDRRKVSDHPDSAWVLALKEGDAVAVAEHGREVCVARVLKITPGGLLKVGPPHSALKNATAYHGRAPDFEGLRTHMIGWRRGDTCYSTPRYLVPPATQETP